MTAGSGTAMFRAAARATTSAMAVFFAHLRAFMVGAFGATLIALVVAFSNPLHSPGDTAVPVPTNSIPNSIKTGSVSGTACGSHGPIVSATLSNNASDIRLYDIVCQDGTSLTVGGP